MGLGIGIFSISSFLVILAISGPPRHQFLSPEIALSPKERKALPTPSNIELNNVASLRIGGLTLELKL